MIFFHKLVHSVHIVLQIRVHGDEDIGIFFGGHQSGQKGVLMTFVVGKFEPADLWMLPVLRLD